MCELPLARHQAGWQAAGRRDQDPGRSCSAHQLCVCVASGTPWTHWQLASGSQGACPLTLTQTTTVLRELRLATRPSRHHQESRSSPSRTVEEEDPVGTRS